MLTPTRRTLMSVHAGMRTNLVAAGGGSGTRQRKRTMPKSKDLCRGCHFDIYNQRQKHGCWSYGSAKVVKRLRVHSMQNPPYHWHPVKVLSCYHVPMHAFLPKDDCRIVKAK